MGCEEGGWLCVAGAEGRAVEVDVEGSGFTVAVWVREGARSEEDGRADSALTASNRVDCLSRMSKCARD